MKFIVAIGFLILGLFFAGNCQQGKSNNSNMKLEILYQYSDGSGNSYTVKPGKINYDPVRPEESSTGFYSGGKPVTDKAITAESYSKLQTLINGAVANTSVHIKNRVKMSGWIQIQTGEDLQTCILKPGSEEQKKIESLLKEMIK